jgi:5-methylcytosine-specific restriction endonuclease McrA
MSKSPVWPVLHRIRITPPGALVAISEVVAAHRHNPEVNLRFHDGLFKRRGKLMLPHPPTHVCEGCGKAKVFTKFFSSPVQYLDKPKGAVLVMEDVCSTCRPIRHAQALSYSGRRLRLRVLPETLSGFKLMQPFDTGTGGSVNWLDVSWRFDTLNKNQIRTQPVRDRSHNLGSGEKYDNPNNPIYKTKGESGPVVVVKKRRTVRVVRDTINDRLWFYIMKRDDYKCKICGRTAAMKGVVLNVDHKMPVALGGTSTIENLWVLCRRCNSGKGADTL